jgi:hypothetical protein
MSCESAPVAPRSVERLLMAENLNILNTAAGPSPATPEKTQEKPESRSIPAWYPNHMWSIDTTTVLCWALWSIRVLVAVDHFSRKVICVVPLQGPRVDHQCLGMRHTRTRGAKAHHLRPSQGLCRQCLCRTTEAMEHQTPLGSRRKTQIDRRNRAGDQDPQVRVAPMSADRQRV